MALANELDVPFSFIIPTHPYFVELGDQYDPNDSSDLRVQAQADLRAFLIKLLDGGFGALPSDFSLEIGNETFARGWQADGAGYESSGSYGELANLFLSTIREVVEDPNLNPSNFDFNVVVQVGIGNPGFMLNEISEENYGVIDSLTTHDALNAEADSFQFEPIVNAVAVWEDRVGHELDLYLSAWNVGKAVNFYNSDGSPRTTYMKNGVETSSAEFISNEDIGARQATGTIGLFAEMIATGADMLALWGTVSNTNSYFSREDIAATRDGVAYREATSHGGVALRQLNESLIGMALLEGTVVNGEWAQNHNTINYNSFAYEDNAKMVLFLTAGNISDSNGLDVDIDLSGFEGIGYIWAEIIRTEIPEGFEQYSLTTLI